MGFVYREEAGARNFVSFRVKRLQPAMKRYLLCAAVAAGMVSTSNRFPLGVLQRVVVHMCVVLGCFGICGCRSPCNGCMNVVMFCRHVRREMRVGLATSCCKTECSGCMNVAWGLLWGGSRSTKLCVFPCKAAAAGDERYLLCAAVAAGMVSTSNRFPLVFCNVWLFICA